MQSVASEACETTPTFLEKIPTDLIVICRTGQSTKSERTIILEYQRSHSLMNILSIIAFHNSVVSVLYDEIVFHVELNISVVSVVNISALSAQSIYQCSQCSQYISIVSVVNISAQSVQSIYQRSQYSQDISVVTVVNISAQSSESMIKQFFR